MSASTPPQEKAPQQPPPQTVAVAAVTIAASTVGVVNAGMNATSAVSQKAKDIAGLVDQEAQIVEVIVRRDNPQTAAQGVATATRIAEDTVQLANQQIQGSTQTSENLKLAAAITSIAAPIVESAVVVTAGLVDQGKCSCTCLLV